jgi:hypothetical protein
MRKHCSNVCKMRPCLATESTNSARMHTIVTAALQQQDSQTELIFWITLVYTRVLACSNFSPHVPHQSLKSLRNIFSSVVQRNINEKCESEKRTFHIGWNVSNPQSRRRYLPPCWVTTFQKQTQLFLHYWQSQMPTGFIKDLSVIDMLYRT